MVLGAKMANVKELNSIELASYTLTMTGIAVLFSVISSIVIAILVAAVSPGNIGVMLYIFPTVIVGAFMLAIYSNFSQGLFYNLLAKKIKTPKLTFDGDTLVKISSTETATMVGLITLIECILVYLVSLFILPLVLNATIQTLLFSGQEGVAYTLYQFMALLNQPTTIAMFLIGSFIITFVFTLLGTYIYNILGNMGRGIDLKLSQENEWTAVESIDMMKFAVAFAIVGGILNLIMAIITMVSGGAITGIIINIISGFIAAFVEGALFAIFYNFLAPKLSKIKIELIDQ